MASFDPEIPPLPRDAVRSIGGALRTVPEDFGVDEIPLYAPSGSGQHLMVRIEKRDLTTPTLIARVASALGLSPRDVGVAGYKDRRAVTRQWISVPGKSPADLDRIDIEGVRVLEHGLHGNRLRMGHLAGNRFRVIVRGADVGAEATCREVLERAAAEGLANGFGPQRFGSTRRNHLVGARLVSGDAAGFVAGLAMADRERESPRTVAAREALGSGSFADAERLFGPEYVLERHLVRSLRRRPDDVEAAVRALPRRPRDFLLSAWQSSCFNAVLAARLERGDRLLTGDVAMKLPAGACFLVEDVAQEMPRAERLEISPTGPLPGYKMTRPTGVPADDERLVLEEAGFSVARPPALFAKRALRGARRPMRVPVTDVRVGATDGGDPVLEFTLPKGSFATSLLGLLGLSDQRDRDTSRRGQ